MSVRQTDISALLNGLDKKTIKFNDVISFIDDFYRYTPVSFTNGLVHNQARENEGSAKIFGFAKLNGLNQLDTLKLFGEHYDDVLANPTADNHANIRNFIHWGWQAFSMEKNPLTLRPKVDTDKI